MRIAQAPLRISLFGGGTDLPEYCSEHGSTIVSFAINRYMYLAWNERPTGGSRLTYSEVEELSSLTIAQHTLVKAAAERYRIPEPCTLSIVSDVPKGTGLGSSSALAVLLTKMFGGDCDRWPTADLAQQAFWLERSISGVGMQDHLPAVYGGFNVYTIKGVRAVATPVSASLRAIVQTYGLLLYTGRTRRAERILKSWKKSEAQLRGIQALAEEVVPLLPDITAESLGFYLHQTHNLKCRVPGVMDEELYDSYNLATRHGALGGKLLGAGGGGCWFFIVPPHCRDEVVDALGLREIPFIIPMTGVKEVVI